MDFVGDVAVEVVSCLGSGVVEGATSFDIQDFGSLKGDGRLDGVANDYGADKLLGTVSGLVDHIVGNLVDAWLEGVYGVAADDDACGKIAVDVV